MKNHHREFKGFTLIELMITVAIIGILAGIAYPAYLTQVHKSRRTDALTQLTAVSQSLERCYASNYVYSNCASAGNGSATSTQGYYTVTTAATDTAYTLTATPLAGQTSDTSCASIVLSNVGQSATDSGGGDQTKTCWGSR